MPRIAGVDIPNDKPVWVSLTYLYGIGPANSRIILKEAGIDGQRRAKDLTEEELAKIIGIIDRSYLVEGALRRQINQNIGRLRDIQSFRGNRHRRSLPPSRTKRRRRSSGSSSTGSSLRPCRRGHRRRGTMKCGR